MSASIVDSDTRLRVSSVLNRDTKQFGKKHLLDGNDDTCWNSDQGSPQWIHVDFDRDVCVEEIHIMFQGGFAGRDCWVEGKNGAEFTKLSDFYPEDNNSLQMFKFSESKASSIKAGIFSPPNFIFPKQSFFPLHKSSATFLLQPLHNLIVNNI